MNFGKKPINMKRPDLSVIIPAYNEGASLGPLLQDLFPVLDALSILSEVIIVDDGSTDHTTETVRLYQAHHPHVHLIRFAKNCGQSAALAAGFRYAKGSWTLTLDADGQNPPSEIHKLWPHREQAELIIGWRQYRQDPWTKRWISRLANACRRRICQDGVHDTGCSLKLFQTRALHTIRMYRGMHRFLPALFCMEGFRVMEVPVHHAPRKQGKSKYHLFNRSLAPLCDLFAVHWMRKRTIRYDIISNQDSP